ncbi:asparagine synthetase B [Desulfosarcina ovata subsp. sediminis]|uniref:asparagine synthase (glutamine-hydrolyzing) n=1 Tax=Desulfosarcina ovata subsp. sediminis TaxID=885957 RepID=A0A5K7ZIL3_9BACT|nr:asparagine synthase (glutamine-hydrolyzing) [Desulfosarcina ovata]BBO81234.1 asparagine synthetase B [Desulfosarcina ovata subsp. sediminis]
MCGIAGIVNYRSLEDKRVLLGKMAGMMRHRGPDAAGMFLKGPVGLVHTRLSIIDLSSAGNQPIHNEDKSIWIVFNGEIFNFPEIRKDLEARGHRFYTQTDTEVLIHLYEEKGAHFLQALNGQFALAIWDENKKELLLARDRVGIRPLFYQFDNGRMTFGSEIKALFADPAIHREINAQSLADVFTCWAPLGELTPFKDIYQLLPGHYARIGAQGMSIQSYWSPDFSHEDKSDRPLNDWVEELRGLLLDASRIRLRADVPVGAYLSGGIDSTYISSLVKQNFNNRLSTFSVRFTDKRFDESDYQTIAVRSLKTDHHDVRCSEEDIGTLFPKVVWHTETPIIRTAPAPLFMLSRLVRERNFKVVLTGEGADEIFAGYNIFKEDKIRRFWARQPDSEKRPKLLEKLYPYIFSGANSRSRQFLQSFFKKDLLAIDSPAYSHLLRWSNTSQLQSFFSNDLQSQAFSTNAFADRYCANLPNDFMSWSPLSRAQYTEMRIFLSNYLLSSQGDRMAMANSIEGRFPFLDHRLIEFACRLPQRFRIHGLNEKFLLKQAARGVIPDELIERAKQPYRAPISRCFFGNRKLDYVDEMMSEDQIRAKGYFEPNKVSRLIAKCGKGKGQLLSERENMALVGILSTQLLDHQFISSFPPQADHLIDDIAVLS